MNWYRANSKICLTQFATHPKIAATSRSAPNMETEQHPQQQSPPVIASMHDEGLQPHAQSYEFTPEPQCLRPGVTCYYGCVNLIGKCTESCK